MYKPTLHSHTHCQAAQANAQTQAWQRVCLSNRTLNTTDKSADEKEHRTGNSRLPQWGLTWLNQMQCLYQSLCLVDSEVLLNPPLQQAAKRV